MGVEGLRPQRPRALLGSTAAILRPFGSASFTPASRRSARPIDGLFSANNGHALTNLLGHTEVQNLRAAHSPIRVFVPTLSDRAAVHKTNNAVKATNDRCAVVAILVPGFAFANCDPHAREIGASQKVEEPILMHDKSTVVPLLATPTDRFASRALNEVGTMWGKTETFFVHDPGR
jgi:hypothetical protein